MQKAYFSFAVGIEKPIEVPKGTVNSLREHVALVEATLNIKRERYLDNPEHWIHSSYDDIEDETLCEVAMGHNQWIRNTYESITTWVSDPPVENETLTEADFAFLLPALRMIDVPVDRWTREYYFDRMVYCYEAMRGKESEGYRFNSKALTPKQANAVIHLFSKFLDLHDIRLEVPKGHDYLAAHDDGGYEWCETCCAALTWEDGQNCRKKKCALRES